MSTLAVATIKSLSSSPPVFQNTSGTEKGQLAKAWVSFNGTGTVAIRDSFNVSSITDNGTGDYRVNFTNAMSNANYSAVASVNSLGSINGSNNCAMIFARSGATNNTPSTGSFACCAYHSNNNVNQDVSFYCVSVFGDN